MDFYDKHPILSVILMGGGTYLAYRWLVSTDAPAQSPKPLVEFEMQPGDANWHYVKAEGQIVGQMYLTGAGSWVAMGDDPNTESPAFETHQQAEDWLREYYAD